MSPNSYLEKWSLTLTRKIATTPTSQVFLVQLEGDPAVLKVLTELGQEDEAAGAHALRCFDGRGAVRLLNADTGAHLLSYADGPVLKSLSEHGKDSEATCIISEVLKKLHSCPVKDKEEFRPLQEVFEPLLSQADGADPLFTRAASIAAELLKSQQKNVVLHSDIHHKNIIHSSDHGWLAIDPKGFFGDPIYDFANAFYNPDDMPELVEEKSRILSMAEIFSCSFEIDTERILKFAFCHGCLSAIWSIQDGLDPNSALRIAKIIQKLI